MYGEIKLCDINPYIRYVNNFGGPYDYVQPDRTIYDYEMMYVIDGEITIFYDGKRYDLHKSDMLFFRPGIINHMEISKESHLKTHCIHFDWILPRDNENFSAEDFYLHDILSKECHARLPVLQKRYSPEPIDFSIPTYIKNLDYNIFAALFSKCYLSYLSQTPISHVETTLTFYTIITELYRFLNNKPGSPEHPKIKYALKYIEKNYRTRITVEELAMKLDLSPKYFGTMFKNTTGKSVNEFINTLRLYDAKQMLVSTTMRIEEISDCLGYSNEFYFSKRFKEEEGISPKQYRENIKRTLC